MLTKKIFGILILILNGAGILFLIYAAVITALNHFTGKKQGLPSPEDQVPAQKEPKIKNDDIILEDDDLLKDMDLSDLDDLNLDDFE